MGRKGPYGLISWVVDVSGRFVPNSLIGDSKKVISYR